MGGGGCKRFPHSKKGGGAENVTLSRGGGGGGANCFGPAISNFVAPPLSLIRPNDRSLMLT